jgi:PAS domain S-box-containing protein
MDITEFIVNNRSELDTVIDLIPIPIFIKNRSGHYIDCNLAFTSFLAFTRDQLIGKSAHDIWKKEEADVFTEQDEKLYGSEGTQIYETRITSSSGDSHYVQFHKRLFSGRNGSTGGFLGAIFDITEKKRKIEELEVALGRVQTLEGLLPICAWCKRMRESDSRWVQIEEFIGSRTSAAFTHAICPDCARKLKGTVSPKQPA